MRLHTVITLALCVAAGVWAAHPDVFEQSVGIGPSAGKGAAEYQAAKKAWRITASGANMWAGSDDFYLTYRRISGDFVLTVDVDWATPGGNEHKKAGPIVRAGLAPDDVYADVAQHGVGLISFKYRSEE